MREFALRGSFHLRSYNTLPASGEWPELQPAASLAPLPRSAIHSLESMAKNSLDLCRHGVHGSPRSQHWRHTRERAYAPLEVGRWLMDAEFIIRGAHDAATLRIATSCTPRVIMIARKSLCESAQVPESTRASPYRSVKLILILISDCSKVAKFVPLKPRSHV